MINRFEGKFVLFLCAMYSLIAGLYPFELAGGTVHGFGKLPWGLFSVLAVPIEGVGVGDLLINIVYFLPWGVVVYLSLGSLRGRTPVLFSAALVGGIVSLGIELGQIFFTRHPSGFDVLANMLGATLGALACTVVPIDVRGIGQRFWASIEHSRLFLTLVVLFGAVPFIVTVVKSPWFGFHNWDRNFTFQLGNEATLNRPWLGTLYLAAVYNRALSPGDVARFYETGLSQSAIAERSSKNLIALYTFGESDGPVVRDVSGYGPPLDLTLDPSSHFRRLGNGIEILKPAILKSQGPAEKLYERLSASNELSIEVWMMPADVEQRGPARIVSLSRDSVARNFTVGQDGADIDFRLRTPISGTNGTPLNLSTRSEFLALKKFHLVATYKDGVETLFVDGREHPDTVDLKKAGIVVAFGPHRNAVAQMAYTFFYFFPVSCFLAVVFSRQCKGLMATLLPPVVIAMGLLSLAEMSQSYVFGRSVDLSLIGYGIIIAMVGAVSGKVVAKERPEPPMNSPSFG